MLEPLDHWQERLERHFQALSTTREGSALPVFALEHGLSNPELDEIGTLLNARLDVGKRPAPHWLVWTIYATERGYRYRGDEYWRSFEEHTPSWTFQDRNKVTQWFRKFATSYGGVRPSGPWASHFRIIAWPITHAILPRYLQIEFARALYFLRFRLASLDSVNPASIGRLLSVGSHGVSTRFEKFLEQEELAGRIVRALLHRDSGEGEYDPIYPQTLSRIVADLERTRNSREWLSEARRVASERFRGIGHGREPTEGIRRSDQARATDRVPNVRPSLLLRHMGADTWSVIADLPSFREVAALSSDLKGYLRRTRCRLNGADDTKPAGWLLFSQQRGVLKAWPNPAQPLIQFESPNATLENILVTACRIGEEQRWLFRVGSDGIAREVSSRIARPGHEYIVLELETESLIAESRLPDGAVPCRVACTGVTAYRLSIPTEVDADRASALHALGIQVAKTIRVWPSGFPGRRWDGEGNSEWLTTEAPCIGILSDYPVRSYLLSLDGAAVVEIEAEELGTPTFLRLAPLPAGMHMLRVTAQTTSSQSGLTTRTIEGYLVMRIREPEPWIPGTTLHSGLVVTTDPSDPDLDTLWENQLHLSVQGPENRSVSCAVSLANGQGEEVLRERVGGPFSLPVSPRDWKKRFSGFASKGNRDWLYAEAASGELTIYGDELGSYTIRFDRDFPPIRWVVRSARDEVRIRLIDDAGNYQRDPECSFFDLTRPGRRETRDASSLRNGVAVGGVGGLFVAEQGDYCDALVVSIGLADHGLHGLGITPDMHDFRAQGVPLLEILRVLRLWQDARLAGFLRETRRKTIVHGILSVVFERVCGIRWSKAEAAFLNNREAHLSDLQRNVQRKSGVAVVLREHAATLSVNLEEGCEWFAEVMSRYGLCRDPVLSRFSLHIASEPGRTPAVFAEHFDGLMNALSGTPAVLRAARFVALLCANQDPEEPPEMCPRWRW